MSEESEEVPPEECPPGYEWDWEQGKCVIPDPSGDWWESSDSDEEEGIPSDFPEGSIVGGISVATLYQGAIGGWESSTTVDWWDSSKPDFHKIEEEEGQRDIFGGYGFTPQWTSETRTDTGPTIGRDRFGALGSRMQAQWDPSDTPRGSVSDDGGTSGADSAARSYPTASGTRTDGFWYHTGIYGPDGDEVIIWLSGDDTPPDDTPPEFGVDILSFDADAAAEEVRYAKACESGLPELALGSDFEERENKIGLIDIIAPDVDDWENEVEGSILMDAALSSIAAEFESDFDFDDVNYNSRFEAGENMEISYTSFEDLWGEERQIYWDFMYSSEHAPAFAHSYYDEDDDPVDEQFLAEGFTTVEYNSDELRGLKERFGSDYTWPEIIDNTITSLFEEVVARSYSTSDSMQKHSYDIFKFGVFTSLALGEEEEMEESDLATPRSTMSTTSTTSY